MLFRTNNLARMAPSSLLVLLWFAPFAGLQTLCRTAQSQIENFHTQIVAMVTAITPTNTNSLECTKLRFLEDFAQ